MAPGHEVAGFVKEIGNEVIKFKVGDRVAVGCFIDACDSCHMCKKNELSYCRQKVEVSSLDEDRPLLFLRSV